MSLRTRVLLAMSALAVVVVGGAWATVRVVEHRLVDQIDARLDQAVPPLRPGLGRFTPVQPPGADEQARRPGASTLFFARVDATGEVTVIGRAIEAGTTLPRPRLDVARARAAAAGDAGAYTVSARTSGLRYRMVARQVPGSGDVAVLASPLNLVDDSVGQTRVIVAIVGGAALLVIGLVTWWIILLGVRPLKQMASVAVTIADDELDRQVPDAPAGTEAGDLSRAFNNMLGRLHTASVARQETDARLRQFVGDASHELRTPVQTIRGYSELYAAGALRDPGSVDDAMRRMNEESVRMSTLVDELLTLARLDQVRPIETGPVDVSHLARDAAADAGAVQPSRVVRVTGVDRAIVDGDEHLVRQVFANIVGNALVHTPPSAEIVIDVRTDEPGSGSLTVSVSDAGPGMPPEVAAHAFERFVRADTARTRHRGGAGLGLAIVHDVVQAHGGTTSIVSDPASGTTVSFTLPVAIPTAPMGRDTSDAGDRPGRVGDLPGSGGA